MITLKSPMVLNSLSSIEIQSDSLGAKIMGNYSIIGANITSEDLLHMTTQPVEVFVNVDNSGSILSDNSINVDNSVKLELINQLFNRVMLYGSNDFTYQDEVFVSSVLWKMGITDLREFMSQIKVGIERNNLLTTLIDKYIDINNQDNKLISIDKSDIEKKDLSKVDINNKYETDLYIQNEIFKRLDTAQNINTIYEYNNSNINKTIVPSLTDITFIEQADQIRLIQIYMEELAQFSPAVWNQYFSYEMKSLEINELTKDNITKRIVMAVFENAIDKIGYYSKRSYEKSIWKNYTPIMYKSSADVIERFKHYQMSYENIDIEEINNYNHDMGRLVGNELELADLILLSDNYEYSQSDEEYINNAMQNVIVAMLENQNIQKQVSDSFRFLMREKTNDIYAGMVYEEERLEFVNRARESHNYYTSLNLDNTPQVTTYIRQKSIEKEIQTAIVRQNISNILLDNINEIIGDGNVEINTSENIQDDYITELINRYSNTEYDKNINLAENVEFLEQLNNHNVQMKKLLDSMEDKDEKPPKRVVVDRKKAMQNALKALENPEIVRQEVLENGVAIERELPSQIERILSITDKNTREYYERLVRNMYNIGNNSVSKGHSNITKSQEEYNLSENKVANTYNNTEYEEDFINNNKETNIQNVEKILKSIKNETDINNAVLQINNIITTLQDNTSIESKHTDDYITYLQSIKDELENFNLTVSQGYLDNLDNHIAPTIVNTEETKTSAFNAKHLDYTTNENNEYNTYDNSAYDETDFVNNSKETNIQNTKKILNSYKNENVKETFSTIKKENIKEILDFIQNENVKETLSTTQKESIYEVLNLFKNENVEETFNTLQNMTDIDNAVSGINNIITILQNNATIESKQKNDYITYLKNINEYLQSYNTTISQGDIEYLESNTIKPVIVEQTDSKNRAQQSDIPNRETVFRKEFETLLNNIENKTSDFYKHYMEINTNQTKAYDYSQTNVEGEYEAKNTFTDKIENILTSINDNTKSFYERLISHEYSNSDYYTIDDKIYSTKDIINEESDISIQNISRIIENIDNETDVNTAITEINKVYLKLKAIGNIKHEEFTSTTNQLKLSQNKKETLSHRIVDSYTQYLENVINELENTNVINQVITQNNDLVEKYIHGEVERILKTTTEYEEKFIEDNEYKEKLQTKEKNIFHKDIVEDNINDIISSEHVNTYDNIINKMSTEDLRGINLIHAQRENIQEELIDEVTQNIKRDTALNLNSFEQTNESTITSKQLNEMKSELIRQSEENITRIVNQNIQTQVHTISDMVYLELEKRLKNEQRRRGY